MKLTILGSGTCVPSVKRGSPANFLEIGKIKLLLDIGPGSLRQLAKVNPNHYKNIDIIYLSHRHTDHISDLAAFIQALNWTPGFTRKKDLYIIAHPDIQKIIKVLLKKPIHFKAKFIPLRRKATIKKIIFEAISGNHDKTSLILKIKNKGKILVYSADTDYDSNLVKFAHNCDLLVLENSNPEGVYIEGHLSSDLSGKIATEAKVKKLLLTHFYPPADKVDVKKQAQKYYKGPIVVAKDLLTINI